MEYVAIVPAAGSGRRMGASKNKLLLSIFGKPLFIYSLQVFEEDPLCKGIVLVVNEKDRREMEEALRLYRIKKVQALVRGGKERQHSVYEGLKAVKEASAVVIHDGARPFVERKQIEDLLSAVEKHGAAVLAVPVKDTVKRAEGGFILETLERSSLWMIQTPQAFTYPLILEAHRKAERDGFLGTDDASLVERMGKKVALVPGNYDNIKITTAEDLYFSEAIVKKRKLERIDQGE